MVIKTKLSIGREMESDAGQKRVIGNEEKINNYTKKSYAFTPII